MLVAPKQSPKHAELRGGLDRLVGAGIASQAAAAPALIQPPAALD